MDDENDVELGAVPIILGNYTLYPTMLGQGQFGQVFIAKDKKDNILAVKCIDVQCLENPSYQKHFLSEILLYYKLRHKHVVRLKDLLMTSSNIYIFLEYCDSESLQTFQTNYSETFHHTPTLAVVQILFKQIVQGFSYMASQRCVHRDIKLDNIMLSKTSEFLQSINLNEEILKDFITNSMIEKERRDEDLVMDFCQKKPELWNISYTKSEKTFENKLKEYTIKIIDLGLAKELAGDKNNYTSSLVGNLYGFAPEMWKVLKGESKEYDATKVDLWSIGISLYRFTFWEEVFKAKKTDKLQRKLSEGNYIIKKPKNIDITLEFIDLINGLLRADVKNRYGWDIVLAHPFFCKPIEKQTIFEFPQDDKLVLNIYDKRRFLEQNQLTEFMESVQCEENGNEEEDDDYQVFERYLTEVIDKKKHIITPIEIKLTKVCDEWSFVDVKKGEKRQENCRLENKSFIHKIFQFFNKK